MIEDWSDLKLPTRIYLLYSHVKTAIKELASVDLYITNQIDFDQQTTRIKISILFANSVEHSQKKIPQNVQANRKDRPIVKEFF